MSESSKAAGAREARLAADAAVVIIIIIGCAAGVLRLRPRLNGRTSDETKASPSPSTFSSVSLPLLLFVPFLSSQISCTHNDRTNEDRTAAHGDDETNGAAKDVGGVDGGEKRASEGASGRESEYVSGVERASR